MKKQPASCTSGAFMHLFRIPFIVGILSLCLLLLGIQSSRAGSATWNLNPTSGDWNSATNWTPAHVPNGPSDTATFAVSNTTNVSTSASTEVNRIVFNPGADAFAISVGVATELIISGAGIVNNSGVAQEVITPVDMAGNQGDIQFFNSATAGSGNIFTIAGSFTGFLGGFINFWDTTTAGDNTFILGGGVSGVSAAGGRVGILGDSTAGDSTFIVEGGGAGAGTQAIIDFFDNGSAGNATITLNGSSFSDSVGGMAFFSFTSTGADATLIANGTFPGSAAGSVFFASQADGGRARIELFGTAYLDLTLSDLNAVTIGSLEGDGDVSLGRSSLIMGSNNLSTTFSGVINGTGSLTKIGSGRLELAGANSYTGGTTIKGGKLLAQNRRASATGSGPVQVDAGTLGGYGAITGPVTIGTGTGAGAALSPGRGGIRAGMHRTLTIRSALTFNSDASYKVELNSLTSRADQVTAMGVTIKGGAQFFLADSRSSALPLGTVFTVIDDTAGTSIAGTFSNLANGSMITVGSNTFQASYEGGDGNDLTLTVVP